MIITLYKNCRLNKSYCEVLDTIAPHTYNGVEYANSLEAYLSTLPKKVFNTGTGTIYGTNSGKIPFELAQGEGLTMYDYNYMKIADETNNFVRYCFILSLQVADGSAIAEYEEDVWASYSASMHVRKSLLTRSRSLKYGNYTIPFYKLSMEYEGNNEPLIKLVETTAYDPNDFGQVMIVAQLQCYTLTTQDKRSNICTRTVVVKNIDEHFNPYIYFNIDDTFTKYLTDIVAKQTTEELIFSDAYKHDYGIFSSGTWFYEISNITLIPKSFGLEPLINLTDSANDMARVGQISFTNEAIHFIDLYRCPVRDISGEQSFIKFSQNQGIYLSKFEIDSDFKDFGIGTITSIFDIVQNGSDIAGSLVGFCDDYNFNVILSFQNQLINITRDYIVDIPISVQTADVTQQQKTARELEQLNFGLQIGKGVLQGVQGGVQMGTGVATTALGAMTGQVGMATSGLNTMSGSLGTLYSGLSNIIKGTKNLQILNKPLYRTNKGTFSRSMALCNAQYGLIIFYIDSDNDVEVQANIDNGGYIVNEVVDDLLQNMAVAIDKPAYNVMQFDFVNNYGAFPEDIRQRLVDILTNGFKIWYDTAEYIAS